MDRAKNKDIRKKMEEADTIHYIGSKILLSYSHVRKSNNRWIHEVTVCRAQLEEERERQITQYLVEKKRNATAAVI